MKSQFLFLTLFVFFMLGRALNLGQADGRFPIETPKGTTLRNIFGRNEQENKGESVTELTVLGPNGRMEVLYQNTKDLNAPTLNLCSLRDEPTVKLCESLGCDLCMNSVKCGPSYFYLSLN